MAMKGDSYGPWTIEGRERQARQKRRTGRRLGEVGLGAAAFGGAVMAKPDMVRGALKASPKMLGLAHSDDTWKMVQRGAPVITGLGAAGLAASGVYRFRGAKLQADVDARRRERLQPREFTQRPSGPMSGDAAEYTRHNKMRMFGA